MSEDLDLPPPPPAAAAAAAGALGSSQQQGPGQPEVPGESQAEDDVLEDELLAPWYGPAAFANSTAGHHSRSGAHNSSSGTTTAAAAGQGSSGLPHQQQQQQVGGAGEGGGSSSGRRRPRSSSDGADADVIDSDDDGGCDGGRQQQQQQQWWDAYCGGPGRLLQRCVGHCNVQTDIKEAVFLGQDDALVACGSDDGYVFIYNAHTGGCTQTTDYILGCRDLWGVGQDDALGACGSDDGYVFIYNAHTGKSMLVVFKYDHVGMWWICQRVIILLHC
jgi:WD and tetratricopeptide repeat-containing protein 1